MADVTCDIAVIGAGVLGLCVAAELTARGHDVRVVDPGGPNASSVAAGMIAPAAETLLDELSGDLPAMLRDAADLWPGLADRAGIELDRTPAEWLTEESEGSEADLVPGGFDSRRRGDWLTVPSDFRLVPEEALARLEGLLEFPVLREEAIGAGAVGGSWRIRLEQGEVHARTIVLATGAAQAIAGLPISVGAIVDRVQPIAGQIGRVRGRLTDRVLRSKAGYVLPGGGDTTLIGATMVEGVRDLRPDPAASATLLTVAETLLWRPVTDPVEWRVGVRGASPDGLPMAGPTGEPSIHVALAPRRNGWLLGPLVARIVADGIEGRPGGLHAAALDPMRFSPLEA